MTNLRLSREYAPARWPHISVAVWRPAPPEPSPSATVQLCPAPNSPHRDGEMAPGGGPLRYHSHHRHSLTPGHAAHRATKTLSTGTAPPAPPPPHRPEDGAVTPESGRDSARHCPSHPSRRQPRDQPLSLSAGAGAARSVFVMAAARPARGRRRRRRGLVPAAAERRRWRRWHAAESTCAGGGGSVRTGAAAGAELRASTGLTLAQGRTQRADLGRSKRTGDGLPTSTDHDQGCGVGVGVGVSVRVRVGVGVGVDRSRRRSRP